MCDPGSIPTGDELPRLRFYSHFHHSHKNIINYGCSHLSHIYYFGRPHMYYFGCFFFNEIMTAIILIAIITAQSKGLPDVHHVPEAPRSSINAFYLCSFHVTLFTTYFNRRIIWPLTPNITNNRSIINLITKYDWQKD